LQVLLIYSIFKLPDKIGEAQKASRCESGAVPPAVIPLCSGKPERWALGDSSAGKEVGNGQKPINPPQVTLRGIFFLCASKIITGKNK
jgi:hypothetical protein